MRGSVNAQIGVGHCTSRDMIRVGSGQEATKDQQQNNSPHVQSVWFSRNATHPVLNLRVKDGKPTPIPQISQRDFERTRCPGVLNFSFPCISVFLIFK